MELVGRKRDISNRNVEEKSGSIARNGNEWNCTRKKSETEAEKAV